MDNKKSKDYLAADEIATKTVVSMEKKNPGRFRDEDAMIEYRRELRRDLLDDREWSRERSMYRY